MPVKDGFVIVLVAGHLSLHNVHKIHKQCMCSHDFALSGFPYIQRRSEGGPGVPVTPPL